MSNEVGYDDEILDEGEMQTRTMEIPEWLSIPEVTTYLVGGGKKHKLESEYQCIVSISGDGSGTRDVNAPGHDLPHLLVTMEGRDARQLGRVRKVLEDSLIDFIIENTPEDDDSRKAPPSLGRLLYCLALSAANSAPKTKDHSENRTVLARAHYPMNTLRREVGSKTTKKVWMNVVELPTDAEGKFHGRFLAGRGGQLFEFYRSRYNCQVDIYGVWGDEEDPSLLCDPYVLVTSDESKQQVDKCIQFMSHRIKDHEEKYGVTRDTMM